MYLTKVRIENFRVIEQSEIYPCRGVNLITGKNGAGKTSVIEALYVLGRGRSFRHREVRPWIREGENTTRVYSESINITGEHRTGLEQSRSRRRIRIDGKDISRRSELVKAIPLQLVTASSHELIEKGPSVRRRFLDWGLFHVEHGFHHQSLVFKRLHNQRNTALRNQDASFTAWDRALANAIDKIEQKRVAFLPILCQSVNEELQILNQDYVVNFVLRSNWERNDGALKELSRSCDIDRIKGYTTVGPHRTRIEILINEIPAERRLSRGQQKTLLYAMTIGLIQHVKKNTQEPPIVLIDDLPAELDRENRKAVIDRLVSIGAQSFVSGIEFDAHATERSGKMFHVEQGVVTEPC